MKRIIEFFDCYDWEMAVMVFCILSAIAFFLLGMFLSLAYSNASWLWMWVVTIVLVSFVAGKWM